MTLQAYIDEVKFKLTGGVLGCELDDAAFATLMSSALREIQRYISVTEFITVPFSTCIDLSDYKINSVVCVYRTEGFATTNQVGAPGMYVDPMLASQWQLISGTGTLYNFQDYSYNYAAWSTLQQIRNTMSTDMAFLYDPNKKQLYINTSMGGMDNVTIEYVPRYDSVEDIKSDYWIDQLMRLSVALAKVTLGRIRSKYTQSNALWQLDGDKILAEGTAELQAVREYLQSNTQLTYPSD